jgi:hypothetical protein
MPPLSMSMNGGTCKVSGLPTLPWSKAYNLIGDHLNTRKLTVTS